MEGCVRVQRPRHDLATHQSEVLNDHDAAPGPSGRCRRRPPVVLYLSLSPVAAPAAAAGRCTPVFELGRCPSHRIPVEPNERAAKRRQKIGRGVSPGNLDNKKGKPRRGRQIQAATGFFLSMLNNCRRSAAWRIICPRVPGAYAPGYSLSLLRSSRLAILRSHVFPNEPNVWTLNVERRVPHDPA